MGRDFFTPKEVGIGSRLRSILGLFSSFRALCRTGWDGSGLGWLSYVVGSLKSTFGANDS